MIHVWIRRRATNIQSHLCDGVVKVGNFEVFSLDLCIHIITAVLGTELLRYVFKDNDTERSSSFFFPFNFTISRSLMRKPLHRACCIIA